MFSKDVAELAVAIRAQRGIKLPDAIIEATAQVENRLLLTRNVKDFNKTPGVIFPYVVNKSSSVYYTKDE